MLTNVKTGSCSICWAAIQACTQPDSLHKHMPLLLIQQASPGQGQTDCRPLHQMPYRPYCSCRNLLQNFLVNTTGLTNGLRRSHGPFKSDWHPGEPPDHSPTWYSEALFSIAGPKGPSSVVLMKCKNLSCWDWQAVLRLCAIFDYTQSPLNDLWDSRWNVSSYEHGQAVCVVMSVQTSFVEPHKEPFSHHAPQYGDRTSLCERSFEPSASADQWASNVFLLLY
jgi:hypothetical protein